MRLSFRDKTFIVTGSPTKPAPGFIFDRARKVWFTSDIRNAAPLRGHADELAKKIIHRKYIISAPWSGRIPIPKGLGPLPFQKDLIRFALERNRSYWWADMGTGKGPMAAMVLNGLGSKENIFTVYVCPPELAYNVEAELKKWLARRAQVEVYNKKKQIEWRETPIRVLVLQDTMLEKIDLKTLKWGEYQPTGTRVVNLIVDEADRFKNPNANRTKALFGYQVKGGEKVKGFADFFPRILYMSGTALPNGCALELFPVLSHSAPETIDFADYYKFAFRFCNAQKGHFGYKFSDIKDEAAFRKAVYGKFLYRLKDDVLDLPERFESALVIAADMKPKLAELDRKLHKYSPEDLMRRSIHLDRGGKDGEEDDLNLMTYRRLLGIEKVAPSLPIFKTALEKGSPLIFALHTEVIDELARGLAKYNPLVIDGRTNKKERHHLVEEFKRSKEHRPIIANLKAFARGHTVLKCWQVFFLEFDWVPGLNDQGGKRSHRIGQTRNVYSKYILFRNSVDIGVLETVFRKRKNNRNM